MENFLTKLAPWAVKPHAIKAVQKMYAGVVTSEAGPIVIHVREEDIRLRRERNSPPRFTHSTLVSLMYTAAFPFVDVLLRSAGWSLRRSEQEARLPVTR
jgi:hypothetical protein